MYYDLWLMFKDQFEHFFALAFSHVFDISVPVNDEFGTKKIAKEPQQIQEKKTKTKKFANFERPKRKQSWWLNTDWINNKL